MNILREIVNKFFSVKKSSMEKEIFQQSDIIFELIRKYVKKDYSINIDIPDNVSKIALIASGSSYHSATITASFLRERVHCDAQSYYASEVALADSFDVDSSVLYIFISQSGETSDTNKALDKIKIKTDKTFAVTNTKNSTLFNNTKYKLLTCAGIEKSIASTKAMSAQLFCLLLIAAKIMQQKELPARAFVEELLCVPEYIKETFLKRSEIKKYSKILANYENAAILKGNFLYKYYSLSDRRIFARSYCNIK